jgi:hypothetical protein
MGKTKKRKIMKYAEKIITRAQMRGSKSTTARGAARWLLAHGPVSRRMLAPCTAPQFLAHRTLDAGCVGDVVPGADKIHDYRRVSFVDPATAAFSLDFWGAKNPRKKNIYTGKPKLSGPAMQERWETIRYKGRYKGYTGSELHCDYQSCIAVSRSGRSAVWILGGKINRRWIAPVGMKFEIDNNPSLQLIRLSDGMDYHPTGEDLRSKNWIARCRAAMAKNYTARMAAKKLARENARFEKIKAREIGSVRVTLQDSRRAGNCVEGSIRFAERRLGMTRDQVLAGDYLLTVQAEKLLASNEPRAKAAVEIAWSRETMVQI